MFRFLVRRPIAAPWDAKEQRVGDLMERLLPVASALGLFAEEFDVRSTPRNLPQAFSHLALIEAAAGIRESPQRVMRSCCGRGTIVRSAGNSSGSRPRDNPWRQSPSR
jgi:hypothetical protein